MKYLSVGAILCAFSFFSIADSYDRPKVYNDTSSPKLDKFVEQMALNGFDSCFIKVSNGIGAYTAMGYYLTQITVTRVYDSESATRASDKFLMHFKLLNDVANTMKDRARNLRVTAKCSVSPEQLVQH